MGTPVRYSIYLDKCSSVKKLEENVLTILSESVALTVTAVDFKAVVSGIVTLYNKLSNSGI